MAILSVTFIVIAHKQLAWALQGSLKPPLAKPTNSRYIIIWLKRLGPHSMIKVSWLFSRRSNRQTLKCLPSTNDWVKKADSQFHTTTGRNWPTAAAAASWFELPTSPYQVRFKCSDWPNYNTSTEKQVYLNPNWT